MRLKSSNIIDQVLQIENLISSIKCTGITLTESTSSKCLFYFSLFRVTNDDRHINTCKDLLSKITDNFKKFKVDYSIQTKGPCIEWLIQYFNRRNIINIDSDIFFAGIEDQLYIHNLRLLMTMRQDRLDLALSGMQFGLTRLPNSKARGYLMQVAAVLCNENTVGIYQQRFRKNLLVADLITGHDLSLNLAKLDYELIQVVYMLAAIFVKDVREEKIIYFINNALNAIIAENKKRTEFVTIGQASPNFYCFQMQIQIALIFWNCGTIFNRNDWKKYSINTVDRLSKFTSFPHNTVVKSSEYGSLQQITQILNRFCNETGSKKFLQLRKIWLLYLRSDLIKKINVEGVRIDNTPALALAKCGLILLDSLGHNLENWDECFIWSITPNN